MMKNILYIFSAIVVTLFSLTSCGLEEPYTPEKNPDAVIEFVGRPVGFNNQDVDTKSEPDGEYDNKVCNCYFLLFNEAGNKIYSTGGPAESIQSYRIPRDLQLSGKLTACYLVNVHYTFAESIKGLEMPEDAQPADANYYINTAVLQTPSYNSGIPLGVPLITIKDGEQKACIPMFGMKEFTISDNTIVCQVPVKRLFSKVSIDLKMDINNPGIGQIMPSTVNYDLTRYLLHNLPTKVQLAEREDENTTDSSWAKDEKSFVGTGTSPLGSGDFEDLKAINKDDDSSIQFYLYVPEYYLQPKQDADQKQENKPINYDNSSKFAVYLTLEGTLNRSLIDNTELNYKIYLGGDSHSNYSLNRNYHYKNELTIYGLNKNDKGEGSNLDYRVSTSIVNNPVASSGQSANCYIIGKTGEYTIPAYKGAYTNLTTGARLCMDGKTYVKTRVNVAYNKSQTRGIDEIPFKVNPEYDPATNTISFTIDQVASILGSWDFVPNGNIILELQYKETENGEWKTEWSWHLWCLTNVNILGTGWGAVGEQTMPDGTNLMHDRNIGVVSGTPSGAQVGFYYKYGDHAPYWDTDGDKVFEKLGGGNLESSSTWEQTNGVKSPNDPCPPGYRLPSKSLWDTKKTKINDNLTNSFLYYEFLYYPYSGYLDGSLKKQGSESSNGKDQTPLKNIKVPNNQDNTILNRITSQPNYNPIICSSIKYKTVDLDKTGYLFTPSSGQTDLLKYYYQEDGFELDECTFKEGIWEKKGNKYTGYYYVAKYDKSAKDQTKTVDEIRQYSNGLYDAIMNGIKDETNGIFGGIWDSITGFFNYKAEMEWVGVETNYGYQVRCVSESPKKN